MNWGVCVRGTLSDDPRSSFYGNLNDVVVLTYQGIGLEASVVLFHCHWYDPSTRGTTVHETYNLVDVNVQRKYPNYDPFVLAQQVIQVYYCPFPNASRARRNWMAVCETRSRRVLQPLPTQEDLMDEDAPYQMATISQTPDISNSTDRIELCDMGGINLTVDLGDFQPIQEDDSEEEFDDDYVTSTDDDAAAAQYDDVDAQTDEEDANEF